MKPIFLIVPLFTLLFLRCAEERETKHVPPPISVDTILEIPNTIIDISKLHYNNKTSIWTLNDQRYSGYAVSFYQDSILKEKIGILEGKKQNQAI